MQPIGNRLTTTIRFLTGGIWQIQTRGLSPLRAFFVRQLRILIATVTGFSRDNCPLRASALTFYTLLSIVPVAAMAFGVAKGFGFEKLLERELYQRLPGQDEVLARIVEFAHSYLENTRGSMIAGIGVAVLFWVVIKVLTHIEAAFNHIWEVEKARSFTRKFADYLSIMLICPILIITASSATVFVTTQITRFVEQIALLGHISFLIYMLLKLAPYGLFWILFTFVYIIMPNTRVSVRSGLLAGILAGSIFNLAQLGYIYFQVEISNYNAIYGSFAALPLFLVWLQISWMIVLLGAEFSCAHQNIERYAYAAAADRYTARQRKLTALAAARAIALKFAQNSAPPSESDVAAEIEAPRGLVREILDELVASGTVCKTRDNQHGPAVYRPARDIHQLSIQAVIEALEGAGNEELTPTHTPTGRRLSEILEVLAKEARESPANRLLKDI